MRKPGRPIFVGRRRMVLALAAVFLGPLAGCSSFRAAADRGQRIVDGPGARPSKIFAVIGAIPGYAVGAPFMVLLLPTLPFKTLTYPSSPEQDVPMPILYAPLEVGGGLGAFVFASPFFICKPGLGKRDQPSESPPPREWKSTEKPPGDIVDAEGRDRERAR